MTQLLNVVTMVELGQHATVIDAVKPPPTLRAQNDSMLNRLVTKQKVLFCAGRYQGLAQFI